MSHHSTCPARVVAACAAALAASPAWADPAGEIRGRVRHREGGRDLVVFVTVAPGRFQPPARPAQIDQKGMAFSPPVLPVLAGTSVEFLNGDPVRHNVFSRDGEGYDLGEWPQGEKRPYRFHRTGVYRQRCALHPDMEAYVVVLSNPYFAVTAADGSFAIRGVPDGRYRLSVWGKQLTRAERARTFPAVVKDGTASLTIVFKR